MFLYWSEAGESNTKLGAPGDKTLYEGVNYLGEVRCALQEGVGRGPWLSAECNCPL